MKNIKCKDIVSKINDDFGNKYKPFSKFKDSGQIWDECIKAVNDPKLMNHIIFCNDVNNINNNLFNNIRSFRYNNYIYDSYKYIIR